jgi:hypothetical protein
MAHPSVSFGPDITAAAHMGFACRVAMAFLGIVGIFERI